MAETPVKTIASKDGTAIGYKQFGQGPGLVLVQGTMGTARNFEQLAELLSDTFTVYTPDRRGRGMSKGASDYGLQREIEDLDALLQATDAHFVFGLSAGAIIALHAAKVLPAIQKLAIYEPPIFAADALPTEYLEQYEAAIQQGNTAAALIAGMKAGQFAPPVMNLIPAKWLEAMVNMGIKQEAKKGTSGYASMSELAPTLQSDFQLVREMAGKVDSLADVKTKTLMIGGSKSQAYLKRALDMAEKVLPNARRVELAGLNHSAAWNRDQRGKPEKVAPVLREFFRAAE